MKYTVTCPLMRKHGAIGIFYSITEEFEADNPEEAIAQYLELYEPGGPWPTATPANAGEISPVSEFSGKGEGVSES